MSHKSIKTIALALAVLLAIVPVALAQGTTGQSSPSTQRPGMSVPGTTSTPGTTPLQTGTMGMQDAISATVAEVDQQQNTVTLRMQGGEMVEFKVPQTLASSLQMGDSVQVTIRKADAQKSGMGGSMSPSSPSSPGGTTPQPRPRQTR
jgi:hypothetical protein